MKITRPFGSVPIVSNVVSSSIAGVATYLNASVNSASFALTPPSGLDGPSGSNTPASGSSGSAGPMGPSGSSGSGTYLLSSSRTIIGGDCYTITANATSQPIRWTDINGGGHIEVWPPSGLIGVLCVQSGSTQPSGSGMYSATLGGTCRQLHLALGETTPLPCSSAP